MTEQIPAAKRPAPTYRSYLLAIVAMLFLLVPLWAAYDAPAIPMDEGTLLVYPELILKGKLPYKDFEMFYGPANVWMLSGAYSLFGVKIGVERSVGLLYRLAILVAVYFFGKKWNPAVAIGSMLLAGFMMLPLTLIAFAWLGGVACALWSLYLCAGERSWKRVVPSGVFAAVALLFRPDLGIAIVLSALPLLFGATAKQRLQYLGGLALGLLPLAFLTVAAGPLNVFDNLFRYPVLISNPGRKLPIAAADGFLVLLLILHFLSACFITLTGGVAIRQKGTNLRGFLLLAAGLFSLGTAHQAIQRADIAHVLFVAFLSFALLPMALIEAIQLYRMSPATRSQMLLATAAVLLAVESLAPQLVLYFHRETLAGLALAGGRAIFIKQNDRLFPLGSASIAEMASTLLTRLEKSAKPGQRLFVGPRDLRRTNNADTFFYHLLPELVPATYFLEMNPQSANRPNSRLAGDIASADWVILDDVWDAWKEPNASAGFGSNAPQEVVANQFDSRGKFGHYELFARKASAPDLAALRH
ncbi:MAG: hypothetical protein M3O82_07085 [Verrucomicrobiota bacterium]|nr:hypothetical protein [Verrucomicrobiota bacterium]